ncbi:MAG: 2'-5' RNA ligase family protein [Bacteroidota bacterium]
MSFWEQEIIYQYLFLISPDEKIISDVKNFKEDFFSRINSLNPNRYSTAHISLLEYANADLSEENIIEHAKKALIQVQSFEINLIKFGVFHHGDFMRTIILHIEKEEPIIHVSNLLAKEFKSLKGKMRQVCKKDAHLTIAKSITTAEYNKLKSHVDQLKYHAEFVCKSIQVFKKNINVEDAKYEFVAELLLKS